MEWSILWLIYVFAKNKYLRLLDAKSLIINKVIHSFEVKSSENNKQLVIMNKRKPFSWNNFKMCLFWAYLHLVVTFHIAISLSNLKVGNKRFLTRFSIKNSVIF